jgi:hypothetical protein
VLAVPAEGDRGVGVVRFYSEGSEGMVPLGLERMRIFDVRGVASPAALVPVSPT